MKRPTIAERDDAETEIYRQWRIESRVDGVLLCDVRVDDPRVAAVPDLHDEPAHLTIRRSTAPPAGAASASPAAGQRLAKSELGAAGELHHGKP